MPLDPAAQTVLDIVKAIELPDIGDMTPEQARNAFAALRDPDAAVANVASVHRRVIEDVPCIVYTPDQGTAPHPVLVWVHGGGWVIGSADETDPVARELCARTGCVVVNVDYRLAPEHPFPAGVDDVLAVSRWVRDNADEIGGDSGRVAIGGDSAGGNLSAIAAQQLPDAFRFQLLVYPAVDASLSHPSIEENADGYLLTKRSIEWFYGHYLGDDVDAADPLLSPLHAPDEVIDRLPPAYVITAGFDPLRDEGQAYAARLDRAGVDVELVHYPDQIHAFFTMYAAIPQGIGALDAAASAVRQALN